MWKKILIFTLFGLQAGIACAQDKSADLAIVVGKNSPIENVTRAELAKIFRAEKAKGPDGVKFVVAMREPGSAERAGALAGIYQMNEADYGKYFLQATFVGLVQAAPRQFTSAVAMRQFVAATPGAIGYLRGGDADDTVKIVKLDGHSPGDADYKLKVK
jgi:ABC-type phosphate transport system substrate-binding protein